jgi:type I restriction enzyme S subunit
MKHITKQTLLPHKVLLPPFHEQKRIVDLISSVDSYIEAHQQQLESAKRSRNAVLHELLTAGGDDWVETTLGEICTEGLFADGDWVESKDQDPEGEYRLLQLADIGDGTFLNKSDRWMNREQFNRLGCTKLEVNDVLIARMPDPIGRACLFPEGLPVCATVVDVAIVRTGNETLQKFLALLINSSDFRTEAFSLLTGTTRQRISRGNLAKISFAIPSQEKQLEIVNLISLFDREIAQSVRVIEEAKQLRSGLLSDLLSGEHEIPVTYDKVMGAA